MRKSSLLMSPERTLSILRHILPKRSYYRIQKSIYKRYNIIPSVKDYDILIQDKRIDPELKNMLFSFITHDADKYCSKFWLKTSQYHIQQLFKNGFDNFRQTLAPEYFTFTNEDSYGQVIFLKKNLPGEIVKEIETEVKNIRKHDLLSRKKSNFHNLLTLLLWEYTKQRVPKEILDKLEEPKIGNPPTVRVDGKSITQDIANSALEYLSISEGVKDFRNIETILEIGAGFGRVGFLILSLHHNIRYFIVDIPPALYISQRYLTELFPHMKIFKFKDFASYHEVKEQIEHSNIIFLMPHQLEMLPENIANLSIAINCLNEMRPEIIDFYFRNIDRLAQNFYFKSHKIARLPYGAPYREEHYPVLPNWQKIFWRNCKVQDYFFEALYSTK